VPESLVKKLGDAALSSPYSRDFLPTVGALPIGYLRVLDHIPIPEHNGFAAAGAIGIFPGVAGDVADISIGQALLQGDFPGFFQSGYRSGGQIFHKIRGMETAEMDRDIAAGFLNEPLAHGLDFPGTVVQRGDHQINDLQPG
jgi:hypothetical protein